MLFDNKKRTHTINFRLSEMEFEELKRACAAEGARSVSEFARNAVWRMVVHGLDSLEVGALTHRVERRLDTVEQGIKELATLIRATEPRPAGRESMATPGGNGPETEPE